MKLTIQSQILRDAINKVLSVVDKKNSRPILTNCLIKSVGQKLELIATDLEVSAKIILNAKIEGEGQQNKVQWTGLDVANSVMAELRQKHNL